MNIKKQLLITHSKENAETIANYISDDPDRFKELVDIFLQEEYRISQRSAMVLGKCTDAFPELILPHLEKLILNLRNPISDAVKRNTVRTLQEVEIPDKLLGITADILFKVMEDRKEPVAIKVFTMTALYNICVKEPALANELKILIEDQLPYGSSGFKNRGLKTLHKLEKIIEGNQRI
ncbi:MAG: hypothetical protein WBA74_14120 [Cyclobacteriaceae bacterium]